MVRAMFACRFLGYVGEEQKGACAKVEVMEWVAVRCAAIKRREVGGKMPNRLHILSLGKRR